ncbi:nuclear pore glycoprotein p62 [Halyomorpha halys]|uniref:nuclear pore glycoprotein p62 n=1 Tax=Halyomorpha halys TaxID=286706 RepID=UPI0006D50F3A|nr:nuclear pore glycoprotein p62 [Halyomorpha halys]
MNESNLQSTPKTNAATSFFQTTTPKQASGVSFGSMSTNQTQGTGFLNFTPQVGTSKQSTMFMPPTALANTSTPKTTATGNATLFNITTTASTSALMSSGAVTTSAFPIASSPLTTSQQFKPPSTSQPVQLKTTASSAPMPLSTGLSSTGGNAPASTPLNFGSTAKPASAGSTIFSSTKSSLPPANVTVTTPSLALPPSSTTSLTSSLSNKPVTSTGATISQQQNLTFQQLEELILNKWTAELYEQEKVFLNQATQINIWDKVINENAEKLTQLHSTMEKVRKQQGKINDDLEIIFTHQKDLEACLVPMEKEDLLSVLKADPNRKNLYINAKKIDSQIKTMSEDLKETIEHINETSRSHDTEDPVIQVGRILNAHMESLRWIDEHTARMQDYFDSLLKMHDDLRRECEISKHDVY